MKSLCLVRMSDFTALFSHFFFQVRLTERYSCEASFGDAAFNQPLDTLPSKSTQQPQNTLPSKSTQPAQDEKETGLPVFYDGEKLLLTEFQEDLWKCPFCDHWTIRIRQHLKKHQDKIPDLTAVDKFCDEVSTMKRRRLEQKRATDPERKETLKRAWVKRAADPSRKETQKRLEEKRATDPKRKETIKRAWVKFAADPKSKEARKEAEVKRAADPKSKEARKEAEVKRAADPVRRDYLKTRAQTKLAKFSKQIAQEKWIQKLGDIRRKAQNRKYQQTRVDKNKGGDAITRRIKFQKAVLRGPEFVCSSCHRSLFKKSVSAVTEKLTEKMRAANEEKMQKELKEKEQRTDLFNLPSKSKLNSNLPSKSKSQLKSPSKFKSKLKKRGAPQQNAFQAWEQFKIKSVSNFTYICSTCKSALSSGKMPPMAVANGLQLNQDPDRPILTELENNLIAHTINFQKVFVLQKSRWSAAKGKTICVPVRPDDIMNTVKQLPRLPKEAELIPIKLKRKKQYKGHEKSEWIRPEKLFHALRYFRKVGHPHYQFFDDEETYLARCKAKNQLELLTGEDMKDDLEENLDQMPGGDGDVMDLTELNDEAAEDEDKCEDDLEEVLEREEEDIQNDPVRRQHFKYNEYSALVNGHPTIFLDENGNQVANLNFAPAEGKVPTSFVDLPDWETKSWPALLPDGKYGRDFKRRVKLTNQNYFQQRLLNKDERFAKTPGWVFGAMSHVEAERLRSNANLSGFRGTRHDVGGQVFYEVNDPLTVFDKIKGTPKYWQKVKYEIIAKLENFGPFHIFFTLSCGDQRWSANFTTQLEKDGCKIVYEVDKEGREQVAVEVKQDDGKTVSIPWKQYMEDFVPQSKHEMIRENVLLATRNFQHRVETFRREVIFGRNNPMKVRHISYRVEFQGRGAGHIHGVLWLDMKELKVKDVSNELLCEAFDKLRHSQELDEGEARSIEKFTDAFVTCTRCINVASREAVQRAEEFNWHGHSSSCRKDGPPGQCRWKFPRFPLAKTTFVDANREPHKEEFKMEKKVREDILQRVMAVLVEEEGGKMVLSKKVETIMTSFLNVEIVEHQERLPSKHQTNSHSASQDQSPSKPQDQSPSKSQDHSPSKSQDHSPSKSQAHSPDETSSKRVTYVKMESPEEYDRNIKERIEMVLKLASAGGEPITYYQYEMAVAQQPRKGSEVLLRRDIDEIFINNYNAEWIEAWDANLDISPVYDYFGIITYITDYFTKVITVMVY